MKIAFMVLAISAAVLATIALAYPFVAAVVCPSCYGFTYLGENVYVENAATASERAKVVLNIAEARERVRAFYGERRAGPFIFICLSDSCYSRFGGKSRGISVLDKALFLSPRGNNVVIAAHELSHIELHHRIGLENTFVSAIPQWFDEGLAVNVSNDPRYLAPTGVKNRCLIEPDGAMPTTRKAWVENAQSHDLYAKAACKVSRWLQSHGGSSAVGRLADAISEGEDFAKAFR